MGITALSGTEDINWQQKFCLWWSLIFSFLKSSSNLHPYFCSFPNTCLICLYSCFRILKSKFLPKLNQFMPKPMDFWHLETPSMWDFLTESETQLFWKYLCVFSGNRIVSYRCLIMCVLWFVLTWRNDQVLCSASDPAEHKRSYLSYNRQLHAKSMKVHAKIIPPCTEIIYFSLFQAATTHALKNTKWNLDILMSFSGFIHCCVIKVNYLCESVWEQEDYSMVSAH